MTFKVFNHLGSSLVVQWLRFSVFTAEDAGLIPDQGTKIPEALKHRQKVINIYPSGFMHPYNCFICLSERAPLPFSFLSISLSPNPFPSLFSSSLPSPHFLYNFKRNTFVSQNLNKIEANKVKCEKSLSTSSPDKPKP